MSSRLLVVLDLEGVIARTDTMALLRFVIFGGGIPLVDKAGDVRGAICVSGGWVDEDHAAAQAGAALWDRTS